MSQSKLFVSGIGTDVGKTVVSAILAEAHACSYLKPIQSGDLQDTDSMKIRRWCSDKVQVLPELFRLQKAASPHFAAQSDNKMILEGDLQIPETTQNLLIEGAGGLLVPINNQGLLFADLLSKWQFPVVLVSRHYLGSINHTLLSLALLQQKNIPLAALIWVGDDVSESANVVLKVYPKLRTHTIPLVEEITPDFIRSEASRFPYDLFESTAHFL